MKKIPAFASFLVRPGLTYATCGACQRGRRSTLTLAGGLLSSSQNRTYTQHGKLHWFRRRRLLSIPALSMEARKLRPTINRKNSIYSRSERARSRESCKTHVGVQRSNIKLPSNETGEMKLLPAHTDVVLHISSDERRIPMAARSLAVREKDHPAAGNPNHWQNEQRRDTRTNPISLALGGQSYKIFPWK